MEQPERKPRLRLAAALGLVLAAAVLPAAKCFAGTSMISTALNEGLIDTSGGDPSREPHERARDIVARRIYAELIDGYYGMGPRPPGSHDVSQWLSGVAKERGLFARLVVHTACRESALGDRCLNLALLPPAGGGDAGVPPASSGPTDAGAPAMTQSPTWPTPMQQMVTQQQAIQQLALQQSMAAQLPGADEEEVKTRQWVRRVVDRWAQRPDAAVCDSQGNRQPEHLTHFVDYLRFTLALERAVYGAAELYVEGLVTETDLAEGAYRAFTQAADYLGRRGWRRELDRRTTGLVVKGGAATGVFSAGIAWVALNVLNQYAAHSGCGTGAEGAPPCPRFDLVAGTSTGAFVAVAVDRFASAETTKERQQILNLMAGWFTCFSLDEMFCLDNRLLTNLASEHHPATGVLEFDGLREILNHEVRAHQLTNGTETILTTVDFRSGRLFNLSDQNRFEVRTTDDVIDGVIASAVLPIFAKPVDWLRVGDPFLSPDAGRPDRDGGASTSTEMAALLDAGIIPYGRAATYLDGGIRSELPVLPLVRRGAERVLVASSSSSVLGETGRLDNALAIGLRYIDVSTGGVTQGELAHAKRHAESMRLAETIQCRAMVRKDREDAAKQGLAPVFCPPETCDVDALCAAHFNSGELCIDPSKPAASGDAGDGTAPADPAAEQPAALDDPAAPDAGSPATDGGLPPDGGTTDGGQRLAEVPPLDIAPRIVLRRRWKLMGLFRDARIVGGVHGYDFNPADQRRLFLAGADAARRRCSELAELLGIGDTDREKLVEWCSPRLSINTCDCYAKHRKPVPDKGYRVCREDASPAGDMAFICGSPAPKEAP